MRTYRIFTICMVLLSVVTDSYAANCRIPVVVAGGEFHSMVLMTDGSVWACGNGSKGILGNNDSDIQVKLVQVHAGDQTSSISGFLEGMTTIDGGYRHSIAADEDGAVWAWGSDGNNGRLGNGPGGPNPSLTPVKVLIGSDPDFANVTQVSAGRTGEHSLALTTSGTVWAWGGNQNGQCGDGTAESVHTPILVSGPNAGEVLGVDTPKIIAVEAGTSHSLALDEDGNVWRWGKNTYFLWT